MDYGNRYNELIQRRVQRDNNNDPPAINRRPGFNGRQVFNQRKLLVFICIFWIIYLWMAILIANHLKFVEIDVLPLHVKPCKIISASGQIKDGHCIKGIIDPLSDDVYYYDIYDSQL